MINDLCTEKRLDKNIRAVATKGVGATIATYNNLLTKALTLTTL